MINALVVDLEHWYSPELLKGYLPTETIDQTPDSIAELLKLFDEYNVKVTFAVLGTVAEMYPRLIKELHNSGHEIASHAWSHKTLHELGETAFEEEIKKSVEILRNITSELPIGFRAPSFSIDNSTKWAFNILSKHGFKYDASIFPIKTKLYGVPEASLHIYRPSIENVAKEDPFGKIIEFPMSVLKIGCNIPISGGFYLRVLPLWFLKYAIRKVNEERPVILYIHPWETYSGTPKLKLPFFPKFVTYYGIESTPRKLEALLSEFKFEPIKNILKYHGMY